MGNEKNKINFFDKETVKGLIFKKIKQIDIFTKRIFYIWNNFFGKEEIIEKKIGNILINYKLTFSEKEKFKKLLKMYFYCKSNTKKNIIDISKDFNTNIKNIRNELEI